MRIDLPEPDKFTKLVANITGHQLDKQITGVTLDTREAQAGDLYVAIAGERVDGHDFLQQAAEAKCSAAVVTKVDSSVGVAQICVDDPTATVSNLAREWRSSLSLEVTGITGSNGKTTTKDLLIHIFSAWHLVHGTRGNYNTHLGLPLTLLELDSQHSRSFLEMGANHRGDIGYLCSLSLPRHGLITNIAPSHLSSFGSMETIRKTKGELFKSLPEDGTAFVNADDENVKDLPTDAKRISYGFSHECDFAGHINFDDHGYITLVINGEEIDTGSANKTFAKNLLAASAVASTFGLSWEMIRERAASFEAVSGRCRLHVRNGLTAIDDTYNANLTSTLAAIDYLFCIPSNGKRHFVFGDMLELGDSSESHHRQVGIAASKKGVDHFYCYGAEASAAAAANGIDAYHFDEKERLAEAVKKNISPGDVILFKGSRGMALESVLKELLED